MTHLDRRGGQARAPLDGDGEEQQQQDTMAKEMTMEEMMMEEEEEGTRWWELCAAFTGSEAGDVEVGRALWRSACLEPPLESRLVSADIGQRLRVADRERGPRSDTQAPLSTDAKEQDFSMKTRLKEKVEERAKYEKCAKRRQEILTLLRKQREDRMKKELVSLPYKPK
ncbi:cilia- and flagella-associated protein HOATZ isoform X2 [Lethenteron reissneri]|uniref:cilia- and flagella-associated protein HOATZ isoform X2 n=1 Tax=Lethenteron reissneri TaxID=7753 RepID=UPI002AB66AB6|nr:cilia- and flagella-associated protein HOATZ isoform X2 [Lethenteron reissneri]